MKAPLMYVHIYINIGLKKNAIFGRKLVKITKNSDQGFDPGQDFKDGLKVRVREPVTGGVARLLLRRHLLRLARLVRRRRQRGKRWPGGTSVCAGKFAGNLVSENQQVATFITFCLNLRINIFPVVPKGKIHNIIIKQFLKTVALLLRHES
jgi:hypothetical protein